MLPDDAYQLARQLIGKCIEVKVWRTWGGKTLANVLYLQVTIVYAVSNGGDTYVQIPVPTGVKFVPGEDSDFINSRLLVTNHEDMQLAWSGAVQYKFSATYTIL